MAERLTEGLSELRVGILAEAISQVPVELAVSGRERAKEVAADCLVTIGGGASTGLGKGISLELGLPIIAIPTTYSGSEMTGFCGITIDGVKRMHKSLRMLATTVIYDSELSLSLPQDISAASALNALAHCIDAVCTPTLSPLLAPAAIQGAHTIFSSLPTVVTHPGDKKARNELLYGAYLSGAVLSGGFALQHGLAHVLGGSFGIEHGLAHALVLPHVVSYNYRDFVEPFNQIANSLQSDNLAGSIFDLLSQSGLPTRLADIGMSETDLDRAAEIAMSTAAEGDSETPSPDLAVIRAILQHAYDGERPA